jgi:RimJ/RimL family protein N-acetyltransferase
MRLPFIRFVVVERMAIWPLLVVKTNLLVLLDHYQLKLRDQLPVILRPLLPDDRERIIEAFRRLSPESTYFRFWTSFRGANPTFIDRLCAEDQGQHASWIIVIEDNDDVPGVGGGSFWRSNERPETAEVSFTVADEFQGQGAGTILLAAIWEHAYSIGIRKFVAEVLDENHVMLTWWSSLGAAHVRQPHGGWELTLTLDEAMLPETSAANSLRQRLAFLRAASSET